MTRKQFPDLLKRKNKRKHKLNHNQKTRHQKIQQRNNQEKSPTASRLKEGKKPERKKKKFLIEGVICVKKC
jgi:hypothetical protein